MTIKIWKFTMLLSLYSMSVFAQTALGSYASSFNPPTSTTDWDDKSAMSIPRSVSLKMYAPKAGNQGDHSTALAWSIAYALTIQEAQQLGITDAEQIQKLFYSPAFIYHHLKDENDVNCTHGVEISTIAKLQQSGVVRYSDLPTDCPDFIPPDLKKKAFRGMMPRFNRLFEPNKVNPLSVKKALAEGNPVIIVQKGKEQMIAHVMCVVGYKDDSTEPNEGYFEVLNSRGPHWNDNGFGKISYKAFKEQIVYALELSPLLDLPKREPPLFDSIQEVKWFKSQVSFVDELHAKIELKAATSKFKPASATKRTLKKTKAIHYMAPKAVASDAGYQFFVNNSASAYVYFFCFDRHKIVDPLFPTSDTQNPYLKPQTTLVVPSKDDLIFLEHNKGEDYICILWSYKPLDLKDLKKSLEAEAVKIDSMGKSPVLDTCLETVLGEKLAEMIEGDLIYDVQKHTLNLNLKTYKEIAAIIIEFN